MSYPIAVKVDDVWRLAEANAENDSRGNISCILNGLSLISKKGDWVDLRKWEKFNGTPVELFLVERNIDNLICISILKKEESEKSVNQVIVDLDNEVDDPDDLGDCNCQVCRSMRESENMFDGEGW